MKKDQNRKIDWLRIGVIIVCFLNFIARLPLANMPVVHDETGYFAGMLAVSRNSLNPFIEFWGYKPPVTFQVPALFSFAFGESMVWGRLFIYFLSSLSLWFLYLLVKTVFTKRAAVASVILFVLFPLFGIQSFLYMDALPSLLFFLMFLYFYFKRNRLWLLISGILLVMTKEILVLVPILFLVSEILKFDKKDKKEKRIVFVLLVPIAIFGLWLMANKFIFNWYLWPKNAGDFDFNNLFSIKQIRDRLYYVLIDCGMWLVTITVVAGTVVFKDRARAVLLLTIFVFYFVLLLMFPFCIRYLLFVYPVLFVLYAGYLDKWIKKRWHFVAAIVLTAAVFLGSALWNQAFGKYRMESNDLRFLQIPIMNKEIAEYIDSNFRDIYLVSSPPLIDYVADPFFGYVKNYHRITRLEYTDCKYSPMDFDMWKEDETKVILINSTANHCQLDDIESNFSPVKRFELNFFGNKKSLQASLFVLDRKEIEYAKR